MEKLETLLEIFLEAAFAKEDVEMKDLYATSYYANYNGKTWRHDSTWHEGGTPMSSTPVVYSRIAMSTEALLELNKKQILRKNGVPWNGETDTAL